MKDSINLNLDKCYLSIDGDNIGSEIEKLLIESRIDELKKFSSTIEQIIQEVSKLLTEHGLELIFSAGDNVLCFGIINSELIYMLCRKISNRRVTFSVGIGKTLCDTYIALKYSKSCGKNRLTVVYNSKIVFSEKIDSIAGDN